MIEFEDALEIAAGSARRLETEHVNIDSALNRVLAQDVVSDIDIPPFNKSAMDGFACRRADLANELTVIETIPAGVPPKKTIGPNQCAKIMTGAVIPEGADCVIIVEHTKGTAENRIQFTAKDTADNICLKGQDIKKGNIALHTGRIIKPQHIAILASVGCIRPLVSAQPKVAVIATGDELVEPSATPNNSQIRNSNSYQLTAQLIKTGAVPRYYGIAGDNESAIDSMLKKAIPENDVVIISGGVSVGDYDLVRGILEKNNIKLLFDKIGIKPGKPAVFGFSDGVFCFGLPGNPVSTFVLFEVLVKPFLYKMMGHNYKAPTIPMHLEKTISRKRTKRKSWVPVAITDNGGVIPVKYHGSAHINALCTADGIISIPVGLDKMESGTLVDVRQI